MSTNVDSSTVRNRLIKPIAGLGVACAVITVAAFYGYVDGTQVGYARGMALAPLNSAMAKHESAAIAKVIPSVLQAAKSDKDVLIWAVAVTNAPSLAAEHREAVLAYCQAKGTFFAELQHRVFATGAPLCP